jgi:membrane protein
MIYHFIPRRRVPWTEAWRAALIAGPVFIAAKSIVGLYNRHALSAQKIYGALAAIPLLIAWVQLAWLIILSGALFIRIRSDSTRRY